MSNELDRWVDTINNFNDIVIIAIGMSRNLDIYSVFGYYDRGYNKHDTHATFYMDALDVLIKNNFENIEPNSYYIYAYTPIQTTYDDPLQQIFVKNIIHKIQFEIQHNSDFKKTATNICNVLYEIIYYRFNIHITMHHTDGDIPLNTIDQIIDYCESKIPQYPDKIKDHLSILRSINKFLYIDNKYIKYNLAKMAELSNYNLRDLPINAIIYGEYGAIPLEKIPLEEIPEYYARLTYSYSGKHTKPARI